MMKIARTSVVPINSTPNDSIKIFIKNVLCFTCSPLMNNAIPSRKRTNSKVRRRTFRGNLPLNNVSIIRMRPSPLVK